MTKELEQRILQLNDNDKNSVNRVSGLILSIYAEFESRTCQNCYYWKNQTCVKLTDKIYVDYEVNDNTDFWVRGYDTDPDFGCILFRQKDLNETQTS